MTFKLQLLDDLSVIDQVDGVICSFYYNIRQIRTIRSSLTLDALHDVAYALIISLLDYCNTLYMIAPMCKLDRIQMLINTAAQVVSGHSRFDHIIDFVRLPVTQRVHFEV